MRYTMSTPRPTSDVPSVSEQAGGRPVASPSAGLSSFWMPQGVPGVSGVSLSLLLPPPPADTARASLMGTTGPAAAFPQEQERLGGTWGTLTIAHETSAVKDESREP